MSTKQSAIGTTFWSSKKSCFCALLRLFKRLEPNLRFPRKPCIWQPIHRTALHGRLILYSENKQVDEYGGHNPLRANIKTETKQFILQYPLKPFRGHQSMQGEKRERWMQLCEHSANEQDPQKLMELVEQINQLLEEKERRLGILPKTSRNGDKVDGSMILSCGGEETQQ